MDVECLRILETRNLSLDNKDNVFFSKIFDLIVNFWKEEKERDEENKKYVETDNCLLHCFIYFFVIKSCTNSLHRTVSHR